MVLCKIDYCLMPYVFNFKGPKSKLKISSMDFLFEFMDIHMNEKTTCHDCHDFKGQNINICPILIFFLCNLTPFWARWIVAAPIPLNN